MTEKVTALRITTRYREKEPFADAVIAQAQAALEFFLKSPHLDAGQKRIKPNKATVHTWLCVAAKLAREDALTELGQPMMDTIGLIEGWRLTREAPLTAGVEPAVSVFHDRSTARVADVSSVVLRDLTAWMVLRYTHPTVGADVGFLRPISGAWAALKEETDPDRALSRFSLAAQWGTSPWL